MTAWQAPMKAAILKAVPNGGFRDIAVRMALSTERAGDYILQAPVLVIGATYGRTDHRHADLHFLVGTFGERCHQQPKLRTLMESYRLAYGFRALRSTAIQPSKSMCILTLSQCADLHPSALAQSLPAKPREQVAWLNSVLSWGTRMADRRRAFSLGLAWAASVAGAAIQEQGTDLGDIADFYAADPACFSTKWSLNEARAAAERWHRRIGKEMNEAKFFKAYGRGYDEPVDYDPLPLAVMVDGLRFVALDSGAELYTEGRMMHHCVGTYTSDVLRGAARIYSVRTPDRRLATLELRPGHPFAGLPFVAHQLRGPCNSAASKDVTEAARRFVDRVNAPLLEARAARRFAA